MSARARSLLAAGVAACALIGASSASAAPPSGATADRLAATVQFLANVSPTGAFVPGASTIVENPATQAWGALGLAAAGINVSLQRNQGATIYSALRGAFTPQADTTSERALYLLIEATIRDLEHDDGTSNEHVAELVDAVLAAQVTVPGSESGGFAEQGTPTAGGARVTALAALALEAVRDVHDVGASAGPAADAAVTWLLSHQQPDGSWWALGGPDTETSALAIEAIMADGLPPSRTQAAISAFSGWLQGRQNAGDGGFSAGAVGAPSELLATAAAARALVATGVSPATYGSGAATPIGFLASQQDPVNRNVGTDDKTRSTGYAAIAFAGKSLPLGYVTGTYGVSSGAPQTPPVGLPTGPTLPIEIAPPTTTPAPAPTPTTTTSAPVLTPAAAAPATRPSGITRVKNHKKPTPKAPDAGGDGGTGIASDGTGAGGGGGTLATAGAPDRAGGGGGTGTSLTSVPAAVAGTPLPTQASRQRGGTPVKTDNNDDRQVRGTLIGRDSATPGATGSRTGAPGAAGSAAGSGSTPWWAIALAFLVVGGILAGATLDRRRPELAL